MTVSIEAAKRKIEKRASVAMGRALERHFDICGLAETVDHIACFLQDLSLALERDQPEGSDGSSGRLYGASEDLFGLAHDLRQATV